MDRASTIRFYDHYGHVSAAVCYQNTLHARTGDGRLDHARTHEPRGRKGVNTAKDAINQDGSDFTDEEVLSYFEQKYETSTDNRVAKETST